MLTCNGQQDRIDVVAREHSEHFPHGQFLQVALCIGNRLIYDAEGVAHAAIGKSGNRVDRIRFIVHTFFSQDLHELLTDFFSIHCPEIELNASGENRNREFLGVCCRHQELDVTRWFFQGFQKGIETVSRQHVNFVEKVYFVASHGRLVRDIVQQCPCVFDLGFRGRVDFDQVDIASQIHLGTGIALIARFGTDALLAVQRFCQDAGDCCLSDSASTGKQVCVMQSLIVQCVTQRSDNVILPDHFLKIFGSPFPGEYEITH